MNIFEIVVRPICLRITRSGRRSSTLVFFRLPPKQFHQNYQQCEKQPCRVVRICSHERAFLKTLTGVNNPYENRELVLHEATCMLAECNLKCAINKHHCPYESHLRKDSNNRAQDSWNSNANPSISCVQISAKKQGCQIEDNEANH